MPVTEVHVAVAVVINSSNEVLISLRADNAHQGGLWEFPGGKVEAGESVFAALKRELAEETGINVIEAFPFKCIKHNYSDKSVVLDVWTVTRFTGEPRGVEGQKINWEHIDNLLIKDFPAANRSIIQSLQLPDRYMITGSYSDLIDFKTKLQTSLESGISLVQLRSKESSQAEFIKLAGEAQKICALHNARLLLNTDMKTFSQSCSDGLHLSSHRLYEFNSRPIADTYLLSASCHTLSDIKQAENIGVDVLLVSPVNETTSHPGVEGIGWSKFSQLVENSDIPVYALGGMVINDIEEAKLSGAQGIAAISSLWCR